jgi:asparagine synthase (glutamine-hydrolysing)
MSSESPIRLPRWYASFSAAPRDSNREGHHVGPFSIFNADEGVLAATRGAPGNPTIALFDGYLFERRSLKHELGLHECATDAEIAAAAFERWGDNVFDRLDGSYLLAIWDPAGARLLLGHDAMGRHPVFHATAAGALWFGSNVVSLARGGDVSNRLNRVSLALAVLTKWPAPRQTFFEDIKRVRAGAFLEITSGLSIRERTYFSPWLAEGEPSLTASQVQEQFEPTLEAAVSRCMELAPTGIMLSGGIDSVTIAALAADYSASHGLPGITAVSGRRDDVLAGEEAFQTATAEALGMRHLVVKQSQWMRTTDLLELSRDVTPELPAPSRMYTVGGYTAFYRYTAAHGVTVLLTGSGGDNWVSVGNAYAAECLRTFRFGQLRRFVGSYVGTGGLSFSHAMRALVWSGGFRVLIDSLAARSVPGLKGRYHRWRARTALPEWVCPDPALRKAVAETLYEQRPSSLTNQGRVPKSYYRHEQRSVVNPYYQYEFELGFHIESACGLRLLSPYHDRRLVRFLNAIPPEVLLEGSRYKGLLRPVAERRLPGLGLGTQRKAFPGAIRDAQIRQLRDSLARAWPGRDFRRLEAFGVINPVKFGAAYEPAMEEAFARLAEIYVVFSAEDWVAAQAAA